MSFWRSSREDYEEVEYWKEYWSHPENVEKDRLRQIEILRDKVGHGFYDTHTKEEVYAEEDRLSHEFAMLIANTDITYLYKRPYPVEKESLPNLINKE